MKKIFYLAILVNIISTIWLIIDNYFTISIKTPFILLINPFVALINPFLIAPKNGGLPLTFLECIELSVAVLLYSTPYILLTGYFFTLDSKITKFFGICLSILYFAIGVKVILN